VKLNIGCGKDKKEGYINLDKEPGVGDVQFNLDDVFFAGSRLPFNDNTFEEIYASHIIEHLRMPLEVMQDLWRVAKPGCTLIARVPYGSSDSAWEDPTHIRPYFLQSFAYFSQCAYNAADYGYKGDWQMTDRKLILHHEVPASIWQDRLDDLLDMVMTARNCVDEFICTMTAVKPARPAGTKPAGVPISFEFKTP
jgi:SAM-dependent methyltransferase